MSFLGKALNVVRDLGTVVVSEIEKQANESREIKQKLEKMSDDELFKVVKNDGFFGSSQKEKSTAFSLLKHRGYSVEDINQRS